MRRSAHKKQNGKRIVTENNNLEWKAEDKGTAYYPPKIHSISNVKVLLTVGLFLLPSAISLLWVIRLSTPLNDLMDVLTADSNSPHPPDNSLKYSNNRDTATISTNLNQNGVINSQLGHTNQRTQSKQTLDNEFSQLEKIRNFKPTFLKSMTPRSIKVGDKIIHPVELHPTKPVDTSVRVFLYENFLSQFECRGLIRAHQRHIDEVSRHVPLFCFGGIETLRRHLHDSGINMTLSEADFEPGTLCLNESLSSYLKSELKGIWSYSTAFYPGESSFSGVFAERVEQATGLVKSNGGKLQITSYPPGVGYKTHTDCMPGSHDKRDRFATILVYLQDVQEGGETEFPELGLSVTPHEGQALVWTNMNAEGVCDPTSLHQAAKVRFGYKYILQRWYYYQNFFTLGLRPAAPPLPNRLPDQPRITCDEYEHGSCRWYDEWDYNHLVDYNRIKGVLA